MSIRAVIFDRDLTLTRVDASATARMQARLALVAPGLSLGALQAAWEGWPGPWPRVVADEPVFWGQFCEALVAAQSLDRAVVPAVAAEVAASYPTMFRAYPDARPALAALRAAGLRLAVLTNFELPSVADTLANAGFEPAMFGATISAAALGWAKPDLRAFQTVAAALELAPAACAFVDDLAENVAAARSIGMRAYQIDRSLPGPTPDGRIGSLLDLIGLLAPPGPSRAPIPPSPTI